MSKHDKLMSLATISESLGDFERAAPAAPGPRAMPAEQVGRERSKDVWSIEVDRIVPDPDQPRKEFEPEALERLAESLRTKGQLQPIQVRWDAALERYVILTGERRWRAAQMAGMTRIQCSVRTAQIDDSERLSIQLIENCLREDLSPMEQARAFRTLMDQQGWTQEKLAAELAVSRSIVVRALSLLKLPDAVAEQVEQGGLPPSVAHEIAKLDDPAEQVRLAVATVKQGLTHKDVASQVRRPKAKPKAARVPSVVVIRIQGFRLEVSRKAGVSRDALEQVLSAALDQVRAENAEAA